MKLEDKTGLLTVEREAYGHTCKAKRVFVPHEPWINAVWDIDWSQNQPSIIQRYNKSYFL